MDRPMYLAVDFDDTLFIRNSWRDMNGHPNKKIVDLVKRLQDRNWKIILWTSRNGEALKEAVQWCEGQGIRVDFINENPDAIAWFKNSLGFQNSAWSNKAFADIYLDDSALNVETIERELDRNAEDYVVAMFEHICQERYKKKVLGDKNDA